MAPAGTLAVAGGAPRERDGGVGRRARARPHVGRPEHSRNRRDRDPPVPGRKDPAPTPYDWYKDGGCSHWHTRSKAPRLQITDRQAQPKTRRPHGRTLSITSGVFTRRPRFGSPELRQPLARAHRDRWTSVLLRTRRPCHVAASSPSPRPLAVFRKKEARILPVPTNVAQRAAGHRSLRLTVFALMTAFVVSLGAMANPQETNAASIKVVVIVGPVGSQDLGIQDQRQGPTPRWRDRTALP